MPTSFPATEEGRRKLLRFVSAKLKNRMTLFKLDKSPFMQGELGRALEEFECALEHCLPTERT